MIDFITAVVEPIHENENEVIIYPDSYDGTRTTDVGGGRIQAHSHAAIDVLTPYPMTVLMPVSGEILTAGWDGYGGWSVTVKSTGKKSGAVYLVYLAHMVAAPIVQVGSRISAGTPIGISGQSGGGNANGTRSPVGATGTFPRHVHVEVKEGGQHVNPLEAITRRLIASKSEFRYTAPLRNPAAAEPVMKLRNRHT